MTGFFLVNILVFWGNHAPGTILHFIFVCFGLADTTLCGFFRNRRWVFFRWHWVFFSHHFRPLWISTVRTYGYNRWLGDLPPLGLTPGRMIMEWHGCCVHQNQSKSVILRCICHTWTNTTFWCVTHSLLGWFEIPSVVLVFRKWRTRSSFKKRKNVQPQGGFFLPYDWHWVFFT